MEHAVINNWIPISELSECDYKDRLIEWVYDREYLVCRAHYINHNKEWWLRLPSLTKKTKHITHIMFSANKPNPPKGMWSKNGGNHG